MILYAEILGNEAYQIKTLMHIDVNEHIRTINKKYLKAYNKLLVNETTFRHKQHYESVRTVYNIIIKKKNSI